MSAKTLRTEDVARGQ